MLPVTKDEFAALIAPLGPFPPDTEANPLMVAVSGGADSMALAFLVRRWRRNVRALVVDHGLREESACEADQTCARLKELGIEAQLLSLTDLPKGSGQEQARDVRFQRLEQACIEAGSSVLLVAHHEADQEETLMMRYERSSGSVGMCGIASFALRERIALVRPLLTIRPERLRATLRAAQINWSEDPSNQKRHYRRVQVRQDMTEQQRQEMLIQRQKSCIFQKEEEHKMAQWMARHVTWHPEGWVTLCAEGWEDIPTRAVVYSAVSRLIKLIGGQLYGPPRSSVERLCHHRVGSLAGACVKHRSAQGDYKILREGRGLSKAVEAKAGQRWDGRWRYLGPSLEGHTIAALGSKVSLLRKERAVPADVLQTLPALWCGEEVVALPEDVRGFSESMARCALVWESGVPAIGERSFD